MLGFKEPAAVQRRVAHEPGCRNVAGVFAPPHETGNFISLLQAIHAAPEAVLVAMFPRAEVPVAAHS